MKKEYKHSISYFNMLKFIGSFIIAIFLHYNDHLLPYLDSSNPFEEHSILGYISRNSSVFVEMFFMISGILFFYSYMKKIALGMKLKDFIVNRVVRIFPLLIITTIVMYIGNLILYTNTGKLWRCGTLSLWNLISDIIFGGKSIFNANNTLNGPIWYINVLMLCYILAFFISKIYKKYNSKLIFTVPIIIGIMIIYSEKSFILWNPSVARGLISFFIGITLGSIFEYLKTMNKRKILLLKTILLLELALFIYILTREDYELFIDNNIYCYNFLFFPELLILLYNVKWLNNICKTKFMKFLGNISFGIYLWNFPILLAFHMLYVHNKIKIPVTSWKFIIVNSLVHIIVSIISYILIDKKLVPWIQTKVNKRSNIGNKKLTQNIN